MLHVYPLNDEQGHDTDSTMCPCSPRIEWADPVTGEAHAEALVIHNAFDHREIVEEAERLFECGPTHRPETDSPPWMFIRDADFGFGIPLLGRLFGAKGPLAELQADAVRVLNGVKYTIPAGYQWNGNSVPALMWGAPFNYTPWGVNWRASLWHDFFCDVGTGGSDWLRGALTDMQPDPLPHQRVHRQFLLDCLADGMPPRKAQLWGWAVRTFGPRWKT